MICLLLIVAVGAAWATATGADPMWVLGTAAGLAGVGWVGVAVGELLGGRRPHARVAQGQERSVAPARVGLSRVVAWWLACRLARGPRPGARHASKPRNRPYADDVTRSSR
ncbi:hypothetical protein [Streptomyces chryseus]